MSTAHTPFPKATPSTAFFVDHKGNRGSGSAKNTPEAAATTSNSCSCPGDHCAPAAGTVVSKDDTLENGSEAFLAGLDQSISALASVQDSLTQTEKLTNESHQAPAGATSVDSKDPDAKWTLAGLLAHNHAFVNNKSYVPYLTTSRFPYKKLVVVTCMDTRLTELLPVALDLKNGDAKIVKVAGAMVAHPFGSVMRSILVAVYGLGAEHILVVGHHDCGMTGLDPNKILTQAKQRGIPESTFKTLACAGLNLDSWLSGFESVQSSVLHSVETIRNHPLLSFEETSVLKNSVDATASSAAPSVAKTRLPKISVTGMVICPTTGRLDLLTPPDSEAQAWMDKIAANEKSAAVVAAAGAASTNVDSAGCM